MAKEPQAHFPASSLKAELTGSRDAESNGIYLFCARYLPEMLTFIVSSNCKEFKTWAPSGNWRRRQADVEMVKIHRASFERNHVKDAWLKDVKSWDHFRKDIKLALLQAWREIPNAGDIDQSLSIYLNSMQCLDPCWVLWLQKRSLRLTLSEQPTVANIGPVSPRYQVLYQAP